MVLNVNGLTKEQIAILDAQCSKYRAENTKTKFAVDYTNGYVAYPPNYNSVLTSTITDKTQIDTLALLGLYRSTKSELDSVVNKAKIREQLRRWSLLCNDAVDWNNKDQLKYHVEKLYDGVNNRIEICYAQNYCANSTYFTDREVLQRAIETIGEANIFNVL